MVGTRVNYGWVVVAVTFLTLLVAAGVRSVPGAPIHPLEKDLGWAQWAISVAVATWLLVHGAVAPLTG